MSASPAIVILSGGMDSTTLLHFLAQANRQVYGISFFYGQRHKKELEFAEYWGKKLCQQWQQIDISFMQRIASHSALLDSAIDLPHEHYTHQNQQITVVPNRNMVMTSIAVAWAENMGISQVYFGAHLNDRAIYPDCRHEFVEALSRATQLATYTQVQIEAPFVSKSKGEIVMLGQRLGVDYQHTWSCYQGGEKHCGKCATCQERKEAFVKAGVVDPTSYGGEMK